MAGKKKWKAHVGIARAAKGGSVHPLESFSADSLKAWTARGHAVREFHYALFYELESQRAARQKEISDALRRAPTTRVDLEGWCRLINFKWSLAPLSPAGSLRGIGGRFNYGTDIDTRLPAFPALYLAKDFRTAYFEYFGLEPGETAGGLTPEELSLEDKGNFVTLRLHGHVSNVFDLTKPSNVSEFCEIISKFRLSPRVRALERKIGASGMGVVTSPSKLLETLYDNDWRHPAVAFGIPANSQIFGKLLVDAGIEAVLYESSRTRSACLAVFTRQLVGSDTCIKVHEDHPAGIDFCEMSALNCMDV